MGNLRGNRVLSGTWGEVWVDGEKIFELTAVTAKITANREDVQIGNSMDSKMTSQKGEGSLKIKKVYSRFNRIAEAWRKGKDVRSQIIAKLGDPDAVGEQQERYSIDNVWFNELPLVNYEQGAKIEDEIPFGFTPSDMVSLDEIKVQGG